MENNYTVIPFGPQHPVLPEPIHLKLVMEDERIIEAIPSIGYVHRGLEKLVETKDYVQGVFVVERLCGICSVMHAQAYCQGLEELMQITVPDRARFLRVVWAELHRMHSHLLWAGLLADAFGHENLFMHCWRVREQIMDLLEATAGHRVIISVNTIGGTRRDLSSVQVRQILEALQKIEPEIHHIQNFFSMNYTVRHRLDGVGQLSRAEAFQLGCVGPIARASGIDQDLRSLGYAAYGELDFEAVVRSEGDSYARCMVRVAELYQSISLVRQALAKLPEGEICAEVKGNPPAGEVISRLEQPRGEVLYYLRANGSRNLDRLRIRTPTFAHLPALYKMLPGSFLADVPVLILTIDPCISCTER